MDFVNFKNLVINRQSCRDFIPKKVEEEKLLQLCDVGRLAPSACNSQPWTMYAVTTEEKLTEVKNALQDNGRNQFLNNAGGFIALCEKEATLKPDVENKFSKNHFVKYDIGELIAYITLCAKTMGLESCIIGYVNHQKINQALNIEDGEVCNIVVALGYSDCPIREKVRKMPSQIIKKI